MLRPGTDLGGEDLGGMVEAGDETERGRVLGADRGFGQFHRIARGHAVFPNLTVQGNRLEGPQVIAAIRDGSAPVDRLITHRTDLAGAVADIPRWAKRWGVPFKSNPFFPINTLTLMRGAAGAPTTSRTAQPGSCRWVQL